MVLDPRAQLLLDVIRRSGRPELATLPIEEARRVSREAKRTVQVDPECVAEIKSFCVDDGRQLYVRLYRNSAPHPDKLTPVLLFFHGGGWTLGDLDSHDAICRQITNRAECAVLSVGYRLAPENKFPAAIEDADMVLGWLTQEAGALRADCSRIAVCGDSAGGSIATVLALTRRNCEHVRIRLQALIYPSVDLTLTYAAGNTLESEFPLTYSRMQWFRDLYLRNAADQTDWRASPLHTPSLAGAPRTFLVTAAYDPLCGEALQYAQRLEEEGVRFVHAHFSDQFHGFFNMGKVLPAAGIAMDMLCSALRNAWEEDGDRDSIGHGRRLA